MALGTITVNKIVKGGNSSLLIADISVQGDATYAAGGTAGVEATLRAAIEAQDGLAGALGNLDLLGLYQVDALLDSEAKYDVANDKLIVKAADGTQKTGDQSGDTYRLITHWM